MIDTSTNADILKLLEETFHWSREPRAETNIRMVLKDVGEAMAVRYILEVCK